MQTPIETNSRDDHAGAKVLSEKLSSLRQETLSGERMVSEDDLTSKTTLDSDAEHCWLKLENAIQLMIRPTGSTETSSSSSSTCSCESLEERHQITSAPMIREKVQSYIGWTSIDAPFGNETIKLPSQLSPVSGSFDASSLSVTLDSNKTSLHLPANPLHTQNSLTNQEGKSLELLRIASFRKSILRET